MIHRTLSSLVLLALGWALPLGADEVHLKNGQSFTDVIAEETATHVRIRLSGGELRLPKSQVERVVASTSSLERFEQRKRALLVSGPGMAGEWLALARWAYEVDLRSGAREAALTAARLDPALPGLAVVLTRFDYMRDDASGEWLPEAEVMERRGLVRYRGEWLSRVEARERVELDRAELRLAEARRAEERERWRAQRERQERATPVVVVQNNVLAAPVAPYGGYPSFHYQQPVPFVIFDTPQRPPLAPQPQPTPTPAHRSSVLDYSSRQPGSLIPGILDLRGGGQR
jgi:hypothetical protein